MGESEIPKKHKAALYDKPGSVSTKIVEVDTPEPAEGEVLIRLTHSGVCHSDYSIMTNSWKIMRNPILPTQIGGHEGVGVVVKLGPGADQYKVKTGDRVGIKWVSRICSTCPPCLSGVDALCHGRKVSGYFTPGTFQQYAIGPANYVTPIPDGVDSAAAAPILCAGVTVYAALKKVRAQAGDWVVISGAGGGLGHLATQYASRAMGFRVIGIDHGVKEAIVKECGAEHFVALTAFPHDDDGAAIAAHVKQLTDGLGAHAVVVCTAANVAYAQSISFLRFNGTVVCVGMPEGDMAPIASSAPLRMISGQYTITGSAVGNRRDAIEALQFVARGIIKVHYEIKKLEDLTETFERINRGDLHGRVVLDLS